MNDGGEGCFPTVALLVKETGLSRSAVLKHIGKARAAGWIKVGLHGFSGQRWANNEYRVAWPEPDQTPQKVVHQVDHVEQKVVHNVDHVDEKVVHNVDHVEQKVVHQVDPNSTCKKNSTGGENSTGAADAAAASEGPPQASSSHAKHGSDLPKISTPIARTELPDWLPQREWKDFLEMRRLRRRPTTARAEELLIQNLDRLRSLGHAPADVLNQSTENSWQGVFEIHRNGNGNGNGRHYVTREEQKFRNTVNACQRVIAKLDRQEEVARQSSGDTGYIKGN
jgi:hypothetical protein